MLYPENQMTRQLFFDTKWIKCQIKCPHKIAAKAGCLKFEVPKIKECSADFFVKIGFFK